MSQDSIRDIEDGDRVWVRQFLQDELGSNRVVSRGQVHLADELPGLIGACDGVPSGLLTYRIVDGELEVVAHLVSLRAVGLGSRLLDVARDRASSLGCHRMCLITTNDNKPGIQFYRRFGLKPVAVHENALQESRELKPDIPMTGWGDQPTRDEIKLELRL